MDPRRFVTAAVTLKSPGLLNNWLKACRISLDSLAESSEMVRPPPEARCSRLQSSFNTLPEMCDLALTYVDAVTLWKTRCVNRLWCRCAEREQLWVPFLGSSEKAVLEWMNEIVRGEPPEDETSWCDDDLPLVPRGSLLPREPPNMVSVVVQFLKLDCGRKIRGGSARSQPCNWGQAKYEGNLGYSLVVDGKVGGKTVVGGRYCLQLEAPDIDTGGLGLIAHTEQPFPFSVGEALASLSLSLSILRHRDGRLLRICHEAKQFTKYVEDDVIELDLDVDATRKAESFYDLESWVNMMPTSNDEPANGCELWTGQEIVEPSERIHGVRLHMQRAEDVDDSDSDDGYDFEAWRLKSKISSLKAIELSLPCRSLPCDDGNTRETLTGYEMIGVWRELGRWV